MIILTIWIVFNADIIYASKISEVNVNLFSMVKENWNNSHMIFVRWTRKAWQKPVVSVHDESFLPK